MVHMAGLRNGQWGRRGVMRALGVWNDPSDMHAPNDWVSVKSPKLLVVDGDFVSKFRSMAEFDRFAARLLLLATLLGRRAVMPSMPCTQNWAQAAMEPRHLRGLEVGCGKHKQCVWLPMPHFKDPWCNGVDFLYSIDYEGMVDAKQIDPTADVATMRASELSLSADSADAAEGLLQANGSPFVSEKRVLRLTGGPSGDPLEWLQLEGFRDKKWRAGLPSRVGEALKAASLGAAHAGLGLSDLQMGIMSDCLQSLATSRD